MCIITGCPNVRLQKSTGDNIGYYQPQRRLSLNYVQEIILKFRNLITTMDYHHGQASRTVIAGYPPIIGSTMAEKSRYYDEHLSWIHRSLIREPRGHANMLGSILTEPVSREAALGVLYLHAEGQFAMCGDSAFATAFAVLENGMVKPVAPVTEFAMDTVAGLVRVRAYVDQEVITRVTLENVPSFYIDDYEIEIADGTPVTIEVAYGGLYFAFIDSRQLGLPLTPENGKRIIDMGMEVIEKLNVPGKVQYPPGEKGPKIHLATFYTKNSSNKNYYRAANVYPPGRLGRTPSGTGISAHMAIRHHKKELGLDQDFVQESIVGTIFTGRLTGEIEKEIENIRYMTVIPEITTKSYLMGIHQFVIDPQDPFREGFTMNDG
jgi:proline racemase